MNKKQNLIHIFGKVLLELLTYLRKLSIAIFVFTIISLVKEYIFLNVIQQVTNTSAKMVTESNSNDKSYLWKLIGYVLIMFLFFTVGQYSSIIKIKYNAAVDIYVDAKMKNKLKNVQYENFESNTMGEKIKRVSLNIKKGYTSAVESIVKMVELILYMVVYTIFLIQFNPIFALSVIFAVVVSGLLVTKMSNKQYKAFADITNLNQKRDYMNDLPIGKETHQEHQSNRLFQKVFRDYTKVYDEASKEYLQVHLYTIFAESRALIVFILVIVVAYLYTIFQVTSGKQEIGVLVSLIFIFGTLFNKSSSLSYYLSNRITELLCVGEFYELLALEEENENLEENEKSVENENPIGIIAQNRNMIGNIIELHHVRYQYPQSEKMALEDINLNIKKHEKIAIVGLNGSGKTTVTNILLGLLTNYDGEIKINNKKYDKKCKIPTGYIKSMNQDFHIFQTSLKDNILLENSSEDKNTDQKLNDIIATVGMEQIINNLPKKLNTEIGQLTDDGIELSKGQSQKIAAARLLSNMNSDIWILDEPTAYLDPLAEIEMYDFFYRIGFDKTILFISHRLGFAKRADRIIVFDQGKVIENGTHNELMKKNGRYAELYNAQKEWYTSEE